VGLIHMNGRVYDPAVGRFLSRDPYIDGVASSQGANGYAYVGNNPLTYIDPSGYGLEVFVDSTRLRAEDTGPRGYGGRGPGMGGGAFGGGGRAEGGGGGAQGNGVAAELEEVVVTDSRLTWTPLAWFRFSWTSMTGGREGGGGGGGGGAAGGTPRGRPCGKAPSFEAKLKVGAFTELNFSPVVSYLGVHLTLDFVSANIPIGQPNYMSQGAELEVNVLGNRYSIGAERTSEVPPRGGSPSFGPWDVSSGDGRFNVSPKDGLSSEYSIGFIVGGAVAGNNLEHLLTGDTKCVDPAP
jgi:hypothetical protein